MLRRNDVQQSPDESEKADRDHCVVALVDVSRPEEHAVHGNAPQRATQILIESMRDETPLHFFAHAPRDHDDDREDQRVAACAQHVLERIRRDVVQLRRKPQNENEHQRHEHEDSRQRGDSNERLPNEPGLAEQHLAGGLVMRAQERQDESDDQ